MENKKNEFMIESIDKPVENMWQDLKEIINQGISKFVPQKIISAKKSLPWINGSIKRQIRKREKLYQQQKHSTDLSLEEKFRKCKSMVKRAIDDAHIKYLEQILGIPNMDENQNNAEKETKFSTKLLFSYLKSSRQDNSGIAPFKCPIRNKTFSDTQTKAELLNSQFQSVFTPMSPQENTHTDIKFPVMPEINISLNGVTKLLSNLDPNKAAGPDAIKPLILKNLKTQISPMVQIIFQKSLDSGCIPSDWIKASVCPLYKKGDKSNPANYRPISLTCILCKVLEHIIASNLCKHFSDNNILYDLQHGFRERRSCETQLLHLVEDISRNMDKGHQTDLILLDFSKAFDKVNHMKLISK